MSQADDRMLMNDIALVAVYIVLVMPAIILHEVAHGYVAYLLGDPTAKTRGRLTLNPIAHIDLWGTVLMPTLLLLTAGFAFGYAKPVPIDPSRFTRSSVRTGMLLTGAAGPATNIVLAIIGAGAFRLTAALAAPAMVMAALQGFVLINLALAFLNLIPIPPLDGSRIVQRFLGGEALRVYASVEPWGFGIVLLIVFIVPRLIGVDIIDAYFGYTVRPLMMLLTGGSPF